MEHVIGSDEIELGKDQVCFKMFLLTKFIP